MGETTPRADEANDIYHMLNRGNRREPVFHKTEDFEAFERMMVEALERSQIKLFGYRLLPNHRHMVVGPEVDGEMGRLTLPETVICIRADSSENGSTAWPGIDAPCSWEAKKLPKSP